MIEKTRARFSGGALHPLEPLDLAEGQEVLLSIQEIASADSGTTAKSSETSTTQPTFTPDQTRKALRATAGSWKGNSDPEELKRSIYEDRLKNSRPETRP